MRKAKDKRIRKLKKLRIWPSVLGLFLITIIFIALAEAIIVMSVADVIQNKLVNGHEMSTQLVQRHITSDLSQLPKAYGGILDDIELLEEIEAVCVLRSGKQVWSSGGQYPNTDNRFEYVEMFSSETTEPGYSMIMEMDKQNVFIEEDGVYNFNDDLLKIIDFNKMISQLDKGNADESILSLKLWYVIPMGEFEVLVLNDVCVYVYDVLFLFVITVLFAFVLIVFIIYYILTFFGMIINQRKVVRVLYTDVVTGGDNWLSFIRKSNRVLKSNRYNKRNYAMVHLRMEKYRSFCTCFGVKEGEELLERFYQILKKRMNRKEVMAHYERADFALLIRYANEEALITRIESIKQALNAVTPNIKLYFNVGVNLIEKGNCDAEELYNNAMSASSMMGKDIENRIAFFNIEMKKQQLWERKVEDEMERALKNKEYKVYLQPKYSAKEEEIAGAEALVRWIHPTEGFVPPNKFIPIFEKNGFILQLDDYMLEEVAKQQAKWMSEGKKVVPVSVNISRAHFTRADLAEHICEIVDKYHVPHHVIELELTESAFFDDKEVLLDTVRKLREYDFILSMDDFGAGYSSLNSLKELQLDVLKIDADFFRGVDSADRGMLIVSEVIDLAKKLNMKIVAEGIESRDQVDFLAAQECDLIQGYYFAKPMPIEEFEEKYKEK